MPSCERMVHLLYIEAARRSLESPPKASTTTWQHDLPSPTTPRPRSIVGRGLTPPSEESRRGVIGLAGPCFGCAQAISAAKSPSAPATMPECEWRTKPHPWFCQVVSAHGATLDRLTTVESRGEVLRFVGCIQSIEQSPGLRAWDAIPSGARDSTCSPVGQGNFVRPADRKPPLPVG
jgi:hypothetical protein